MKAEDTLFRTIVDVPKWDVPIQAHDKFVLLGSCFAQSMGERFRSYGLHALCNPLGVTYNPESIATQVEQALTPNPSLPVFKANGGWKCWWAGTLIAADNEPECRQKVAESYALLGQALRQADVLFITLGTNVCYRLKENDMTVMNCHKMPGGVFKEVRLELERCTEVLTHMVDRLETECPQLRVVFTVSPYRYAKYGFHGSQVAKATLLLTVDRLCRLRPEKVGYFPAYEIVMDELRDYRFYADDMIHPSPTAIDYIWQRLKESAMSRPMQQYLEQYAPIRRALLHNPQDAGSEAYAKFLKEVKEKGQKLQETWQVPRSV